MDALKSEVNDGCPGIGSESAGKAATCAGCPNQNICAERNTGPDPGIDQVRLRLSSVKHKVLVLSGKGGVGKSTVTSLLARLLAATDEDKNIAICDIDVCGPSMPLIMGAQDENVHQSGSGWSPVYVDGNIGVMSIGFLLGNPDNAVIWRGPKKNAMIRQFLADVDWGDVDYMFIDTPPGTSDEHISVTQYLSQAGLDGAILVTTPQEVSLIDVRKEVDFCRKTGIRILGVVENMSSFICPNCSNQSIIFPPTTGGALKMCADMGLNFLGRLPLDPKLARSCDEGKDFIVNHNNSPAAQAMKLVLEHLLATLSCEGKEENIITAQ